MDAAESLAEDVRIEPRGKLRINAPVSFGISALTPRLPEFLRVCPEVTVELSLTNRRVDPYEEGFDVVFRVGILADSSLHAIPLSPYQLTACAAPSYLRGTPRITRPEDLSHHECLSLTHTELRDTWTFTQGHDRREVPVAGRFAVAHGEAIRVAAVQGLGIILQPDELVRPDLSEGRLVCILPECQVPSRPLNLVYPSDRRPTPKLRRFIDFARAIFPR